jgi:hypothetical protein
LATQFECDKGHVFLYPAKIVKGLNPNDRTVALGPIAIQGDSIETHVCPFCQSLNIKELLEIQPNIASVKSVPLEEVDSWLTKGYVVHELYAKTATLKKFGTPESLTEAMTTGV